MNALANPCNVLLGDESVSRSGLTQRKTVEPQQRFADAPALVNIRQEDKSDNVLAGESPDVVRPAGERSVADAPERSDESARAAEQVVSGISLYGWPAGTPVATIASTVKSGSASASSVGSPSRERTIPETRVATATARSTGLPHSSEQPASVSNQRLTGPQASEASVVLTGDVARTARPGKAATKVSKPSLTEIGKQAPRESHKNDNAGPARTPHIKLRDAEQIKQKITVKGAVDDTQQMHTQPVGSKRGSANAPLTTQALFKDHPRAVPARNNVPVIPISKAEVVKPGAKGNQPGDAKHGITVQSELAAFAAGEPAALAQRPPMETQTQISVDTAPAERPAGSVSEQILDSVHASLTRGDREVLVRLRPPELGTVVVRLQEQGERIEGMLEVAQSDTRCEIERALPQVLQSLQDAGIQIHRLEVTAPDLPDKDLGRGHLQEDAWPGQHGSGQSRDHLPTSQVPWPSSDAAYSVGPETTLDADRQIKMPQGQLDILL